MTDNKGNVAASLLKSRVHKERIGHILQQAGVSSAQVEAGSDSFRIKRKKVLQVYSRIHIQLPPKDCNCHSSLVSSVENDGELKRSGCSL